MWVYRIQIWYRAHVRTRAKGLTSVCVKDRTYIARIVAAAVQDRSLVRIR